MPFLENSLLSRFTKSANLALATPGTDTYAPSNATVVRSPIVNPSERTCGALDCDHRWIKPWKSRRRPIFEDEWGCSHACVESLVNAAVRREVGTTAFELETPHRHRVPLGLVLLAQGWITQPQLQAALQAQKAGGQGRIGDWLMERCGLPEDRVTRGLGVQWNCPVLALDGFSPSRMALTMPKRFVTDFGLVPLRVAGSSLLYVASDGKKNPALTLGLEQMTGLRVETGLLSTGELESARERLLAAEAVRTTVTQVSDADDLSASIVDLLNQRQPLASRLVRVQQYYWVRVWLESGAMNHPGHLPTSTADIEDHLFVVGAKSSANVVEISS